jgi:hypothetical protein
MVINACLLTVTVHRTRLPWMLLKIVTLISGALIHLPPNGLSFPSFLKTRLTLVSATLLWRTIIPHSTFSAVKRVHPIHLMNISKTSVKTFGYSHLPGKQNIWMLVKLKLFWLNAVSSTWNLVDPFASRQPPSTVGGQFSLVNTTGGSYLVL